MIEKHELITVVVRSSNSLKLVWLMKISCTSWNSSWFPNTRESGSFDPLACSVVCTWGLAHGFITSTWCPSTFDWLVFTFFEEEDFLSLWTLVGSIFLLTCSPPFWGWSGFYWYLLSIKRVNRRIQRLCDTFVISKRNWQVTINLL
jgi:hypothetical protein